MRDLGSNVVLAATHTWSNVSWHTVSATEISYSYWISPYVLL